MPGAAPLRRAEALRKGLRGSARTRALAPSISVRADRGRRCLERGLPGSFPAPPWTWGSCQLPSPVSGSIRISLSSGSRCSHTQGSSLGSTCDGASGLGTVPSVSGMREGKEGHGEVDPRTPIKSGDRSLPTPEPRAPLGGTLTYVS